MTRCFSASIFGLGKSHIVPPAGAEVVGYVLVRRSLRRRAYWFFPATVIPITSLGRAGVYFGNTRAFVACSKS